MKKNLILYLLFFLFFAGNIQAQTNKENSGAQKNENNQSGLTLSLGAAATYYYGPGDRNVGKFDNDRFNWQVHRNSWFYFGKRQIRKTNHIGGFWKLWHQ